MSTRAARMLSLSLLVGLIAHAVIPGAIAQTGTVMSAADIETARAAPIQQGTKENNTTSWGTTPAALFATDVAAANKTRADLVQVIRVINRHASQSLCYFDVAWSGGTSCTALCAAASTRTCNGTSTDGTPLSPGASVSEQWTGNACLCAVGSAASTTGTAERVMRFPL